MSAISPLRKGPRNGVCHGEIHTRMKLTSVEIINRLSWRLEEVSDVGSAMVSWTVASRSYILVVT